MSRLTLRSAMTALALGIVALGGTTLMSEEASARGFHGGWGRHHQFGGWHGHARPGHWVRIPVRHIGYPIHRGCHILRYVSLSGSVIIRKRCLL